MILLPVLVIILILIGVYLSYQKNISNTNKIVIAILAVLIFNIAYSYLKKTTESFSANTLEKTDEPDDDSYDIEVASPDYSDEKNDTSEPYSNTSNNTGVKGSSGLAEVIGQINYGDRVRNIQKQINSIPTSEANESIEPTGIPSESSEQFADARIPQSNISQTDVKGTGNIFNPQVIVKSGSDGGQSISYSSDGGQSSTPVYSSAKSWQKPDNDLWEPANAGHIPERPVNTITSGGGTCTYNDPMGDINQNIVDNYGRAYKNRKSCGTYHKQPDSEGDSEYPYSVKSTDMSKVYVSGYSFSPPSTWDVPQKYPPVCLPDKSRGGCCPQGIFDRGTPTNVLELNSQGEQCMTEGECQLTNIGSIMPKFEFREIREY